MIYPIVLGGCMDYLEVLDGMKEDMLHTLQDAIKIDSVLAPAVKGEDGQTYPFGAGIQKAYEHMLSVGEEMGFETANYDNYGGHIEFKAPDSEKVETFGITAHLDVVPVGEGWETDPFNPIVKDGWIYGRGTSDDKGPAVAALYAMKAIKEAGITPKKNIRMILGLDEETDKEGMIYYRDHVEKMPELGITPDADFPVVQGEMGILVFDIARKLSGGKAGDGLKFRSMESGVAYNIVSPQAKVVVFSEDQKDYDDIASKAEAFSGKTGYKVTTKKQGKSLVIESFGVQAHGARPQEGLNAISIMMAFLGELDFADPGVNEFTEYYNKYIGFDLEGGKMGPVIHDEPSGNLIFNVGLASGDEDVISVTVNIRYPVTYTDEQVYEVFEKTLEGTEVGFVKKMLEKPVYLPDDDPMVQNLIGAYVDETGDDKTKPLVMGGGTYAKLIPGTLAYGGMFPGDEDRMHQANERLLLDHFYKSARIYARAIYKICCQ